MCGRYTLYHSTAAVVERFGVQEPLLDLAPRYNLTPSQKVPVITQERDFGIRYLEGYQWGLVPFWAESNTVGQHLINARAETADERPAFKYAIGQRRCIIPADGFYEWKREGKERLPVHYSLPQGQLFGLAGLWETWKRPDGSLLYSCAIMTTVANELIDPICTRMPVILRPEDEAAWLDPANRNVPALLRQLQPYPAEAMTAQRVSQHVNSAHFDDLHCIEPLSNRTETLAWIEASAAQLRRENKQPKRRCVRRDHTAGGQIFFNTKSFTRNDGTRWHPVVDIEAGPVFCDCPDFSFRHARHEPDLMTPQFWCKHVARAVENCRRHGEL